jgi:hypothetical protein
MELPLIYFKTIERMNVYVIKYIHDWRLLYLLE